MNGYEGTSPVVLLERTSEQHPVVDPLHGRSPDVHGHVALPVTRHE